MTYYVDQRTGKNTNPGTKELPLADPFEAQRRMQKGDNLYIEYWASPQQDEA